MKRKRIRSVSVGLVSVLLMICLLSACGRKTNKTEEGQKAGLFSDPEINRLIDENYRRVQEYGYASCVSRKTGTISLMTIFRRTA